MSGLRPCTCYKFRVTSCLPISKSSENLSQIWSDVLRVPTAQPQPSVQNLCQVSWLQTFYNIVIAYITFKALRVLVIAPFLQSFCDLAPYKLIFY